MNCSKILASALLALCSLTGISYAQSTLGVVVGTVKDPSGAVLANATVQLTNTGENTTRDGQTTAEGNFEFQNVKPGVYAVKISAPGFRAFAASDIRLAARQTVRVDAAMQVGELSQQVEVTSSAGVIATDSPVIASALSAEKVLNLPGNVRGVSTSPYALIATLPGVQADNGGGYSIQGGLPAQSESSVDGISITAATGNSPQRNLFPSVESIAEIRVQGVGNNAEYGQPGDVTAISKGGTNNLHGAAFWYHQNKALDARSFGQATLPAKISNVFGFTLGGPVVLPKLYNGKNRTFFFFTLESLRLPRQATIQNTVPTAAMKTGNFTGETVTVRDPLTNQPFPGNTIPAARISSIARAILALYPDPNQGNPNRVSNANYINNLDATSRSNQFDVRLDHQFTEKHLVFGRFTQKENPSQAVNRLLLPNDSTYNDHRQAVVSYTWSITPTLLNEFRGGISFAKSGAVFNFDGRAFTNGLNLQDIQKDIFFNALPNFDIQQFTGFSKGRPGRGVSWNTQYIDNLTWIKGKHTLKFGFAIRQLRAESNLGFTTGDNYGNFAFSGNFTGNSFGDFLLAAPFQTSVSVVQTDNDGRGTHYQAYVQDTFRATSRLTLDFGLRYEFQPGYSDAGFNIANFDRTVPVTGRVITMTDPKAIQLVAPATLLSVNACPGAAIGGVPCTPFVTAKEAGLPEALRRNYNTQFLPRLGFAYRIGDKTTVRGSYGIYNMALLGSIFFSLTGTVQSDVRQFSNVGSNGQPLFFLPQTRPGGSASGVRGGNVGTFQFRTANQIDFRPPYMMQWGLSVDRQLTNSMGLRVSYIANKSTNLPWAPDLNQAQPSTRFFTQRPLTDRPFPNWGLIYSRDAGANSIYQAGQVELNRRFSAGLTFTAAYTFAKHLGDNAGPNPGSFAGETGGGRVTNSLDRRADRGDVYATRRHRSINTLVYELPFGKGRRWMANSNGAVDAILGGWQISSILSLQSGPFLTPTFNGGDPSGTDAPSRGTQRPDRLGAGSVASPDRNVWLDRNAFLCPGRTPGALQFNCAVGVVPGRDPNPIGRFGNSGVGILTGPGTFGWNMGMAKTFNLVERLTMRLEGSFTNVPNATNLGDPELNIANNNFGRITGVRGVDFGAGRTGQVGLRLQF
ncbi:MAG: TonB-dependent receptor domain-containing protein [Acidobacteriota bacterium]